MVKRKASDNDNEYVPNQGELRRSKRTRRTPAQAAPAPTTQPTTGTKKSGKKGAKKAPTNTKPKPSSKGKGKRKAGDNEDDFVEQEQLLRRSKRLRGEPASPVPQSPPRVRRPPRRVPVTPAAPVAPAVPIPPRDDNEENDHDNSSEFSGGSSILLDEEGRNKIENWTDKAAASKNHKELKKVWLPVNPGSKDRVGRYRFFTPKQLGTIIRNRGAAEPGSVTDDWTSDEDQSSDDSSERANKKREEAVLATIEEDRMIAEAIEERAQEALQQRTASLAERELCLLPDGYEPLADGSLDVREAHMESFEYGQLEGRLRTLGYNPPPPETPLDHRRILIQAFARHLARQGQQPSVGTMQANLAQMLQDGQGFHVEDLISWHRRRAIMYSSTPQDRITPDERRIIAVHAEHFTLREIDVAVESRERFLSAGGDPEHLTQAEALLERFIYEPPTPGPSLTPSPDD